MAFSGVWMVDGFRVSGTLGRLQLRASTRNENGIVEMGDLRVRANASPNGTVLISDGACVARGRERNWQGSYFGYNIGDIPVAVSPTAGAARHDLIYARVEDPTISSSPWDHTGPDDDLWYPVYKTGVAAGTKDIPAGETGVPLARLDIPAGTTNITQAMIIDLRQMLDPREEQQMFSLSGVWDPADSVGNTLDWEIFPNGADWPIDVPTWAAQAVLDVRFYGLQFVYSVGMDSGHEDARGAFRAGIGGQYTVDAGYWVQRSGSGQYSRNTWGVGGTVEIPQAMRGTTQNFTAYGHGTDSYIDGLQADGASVVVATISFRELPRYDVPDRSPS